mmetsp:Transcript_16889/g.41149  ORF Transcript_16889/g.41149 Transcript_16889/m.41149 type:complete len:173 (+) Transcript_16889:765-1283(+)
MDYTNHPRNNLLPGRANFLRLQEMYGVPNQRPMGPISPDDQPVTPNMFDPNNRPQTDQKPPKEEKPKKDKEDRYLRSHKVEELSQEEGKEEHHSSSSEELPRHLVLEYEKAMAELEHHIQIQQGRSDNQVKGSRWRRLEEHSHGAEFVRRLGEDHHIKVQMLYAQTRSSPPN